MEKIFDKNIVEASDSNLNSVLQNNRSLTENSLKMRAMAYLSQVKSLLLTQTIFEVDNDRQQKSDYVSFLDEKNKLLVRQNKIIEQQKIQIEEQKQQLIDRQSKDAKIGYWTIDVKNDTITWSDEILKIYDLVGHPNRVNIFTLRQKVHPEDIEKLVTSLQRVKKDSSYKHDIVYRVLKKDGSISWIHCRGRLNSEKNIVEGTLQDITDLENTKIALEKQKELLLSQSKNAMMGDMISLIVHQFKQPLSVLSMTANNQIADIELNEHISNEDILEDANHTIEQVMYLSDTMDTFRDFLKPDNKKETLKIEKAITNSLTILNKSLRNNTIELIEEYSSTLEISMIQSEMMQLFINIINNSKDAFKINRSENRKIWIRTYDEDNSVIIEIEDNAGGIIEDKIDTIFDPYVTTKKDFGGTGIGLYIAKTIINDHYNGSINVKNTKSGACFKIILPR